MPNPYHDETGKFCTKGEMQQAIARLVSNGKYDEAMELTSDLKKITTEKNSSKKNPVKKVVKTTKSNEVENLKQIASILAAHPKDFNVMQSETYKKNLQDAIEDCSKFDENATAFDILRSNNHYISTGRADRFYLSYVDKITKHRMNVQQITHSPRNLLNTNGSNQSKEAQRKAAVASFIAEKGQPKKLVGDGYYGWVDWEFARNAPQVAAILSVKEDNWEQYEESLYEDGTSYHKGMVAEAIYTDGSSREIRWEGTPVPVS